MSGGTFPYQVDDGLIVLPPGSAVKKHAFFGSSDRSAPEYIARLGAPWAIKNSNLGG